MKKNNISFVGTKCFGCRACEQACPVGCIVMVENSEGFLYPKIDNDKCVDCGLCLKTCSACDETIGIEPLKVYAANSKNQEILRASSSGGLSEIFAKDTINCGGIVYGVGYDNNLRVCHLRCTTNFDLQKIRGSKYVFGDTLDSYSKVQKDLLENKKVLYFGTPCQISGLEHFLKKKYENLTTISLICHGAPSNKAFNFEIKYIEDKYKSKISNFEFRNKDIIGWGYFIKITFVNGKIVYLRPTQDRYFSDFLKSGINYRESCYLCKYSNPKRVGDICIGDFWGINSNILQTSNGVSSVIINTRKGLIKFEAIKNQIEYEEKKYKELLDRQTNLNHCTVRNKDRDRYYNILDSNYFIEVKEPLKIKIKFLIKQHTPKKIKKFVKKILKK